MKKRSKFMLGSLSALLMVMILMWACNKKFTNTLNPTGVSGDSLNLDRKVLLIVVDGAIGDAMRTADAPNISLMRDNSISTYDGLADYERNSQPFTLENAWSNMLTGVTQTKHKVVSNTFSGNDFATYPSLFTRLKTARPSYRSAAFTSSASLKTSLLADATMSQTLANDAAVRTAALAEVKSSNAGLVLAHFTGVETAGLQYGYGNTITEYKAAIKQVDSYVGELVNAVTANTLAGNQRWLVIIASSKGGVTSAPITDFTTFGDSRRNTFIFFYSPRFKPTVIEKPLDSRGAGTFKGTYARLYGIPTSTTIPGVQITVPTSAAGGPAAGPYVPTILDPGNAYTVEAKFKLFRGSGNAAPTANIPFFSKTPQRSSSGNNSGWAFRTAASNEIWLWFRSDNPTVASRKAVEFKVGTIADNNWHTLAVTFVRAGGTITGVAYLDGNVASSGSLTGLALTEGLATNSPLKFGFNDNAFVTNGNVSTAFADVRVWNVALPDITIYQYSCLPGLPPASHPYRQNLVGFWNLRDGTGTSSTMPDESGNNNNAVMSGTGTIDWVPFSEISNSICPDPEPAYFRKVPNSVDIPFEVMRWLGVSVIPAYNLDGIGWIPQFNDIY